MILPIGGPGPALTPIQMGSLVFSLIGQPPQFRRVPSSLFIFFAYCLTPLTLFSKRIRDVKQFLSIAHYYATESMLVYDESNSRYDDTLTPEFGSDTLESHYRKLLSSDVVKNDLGAHKLF